jgi:gas vesicle protein
MEKTNHTGTTAIAFFLGGAMGAAAALLFAPHSGAESRHRIARGAQNLRGSGETFAHDVEDKVEAVGGAIKTAVSEARDTYRTELGKSRDRVAEEMKSATSEGDGAHAARA